MPNDGELFQGVAARYSTNENPDRDREDTLQDKLQREFGLLEAVGTGFNARLEHVTENKAESALEFGTSAALGAGLMLAHRLGGKYAAVARTVGTGFGLMMGWDLLQRGKTAGAAAIDSWQSGENQARNEAAVASSLGTAAFDYPVGFATGLAGAGAVYGAPRAAAFMRTALSDISLRMPELQPNFASQGAFGAVEKRGDIFQPFRERIELPNRTKFGRDPNMDAATEMRVVLQERQVATNPEVVPIRQQMITALKQADEITPKLQQAEAHLGRINQQINAKQNLVEEVSAVQRAESNIRVLDRDLERLPQLRQELSQKGAELREQRRAARTEEDVQAGSEHGQRNVRDRDAREHGRDRDGRDRDGRDEFEEVNPLEAEVNALRQEITSIESRQASRNQLDQELSQANLRLQQRREAVQNGTADDINALKAQAEPYAQEVAGYRSQLSQIQETLTSLNGQYTRKAEIIMASSETALVPPPEPVVRPEPVRTQRSDTAPKANRNDGAGSGTTTEETIAGLFKGKQNEVRPVGQGTTEAVAPPAGKDVSASGIPVTRDAGTHSTRDAGISANRQQGTRDQHPVREQQGGRDQQSVREQQGGRDQHPVREQYANRDTERAYQQTAPRRVTEESVRKAHDEAFRSVETFERTGTRHTTALKGIHDYIDLASRRWVTDAQAADREPAQVLASVRQMLGKLENWDRPSPWFKDYDRRSLMQRNGFDEATMGRFDAWYRDMSRPFVDNTNPPAAIQLAEIQAHLQRRVAVESVKNYLRLAPDVDAAVSPIVQRGFNIAAEGRLPDGTRIPENSTMVVFVRENVNGENIVVPFTKANGRDRHIQWFDVDRIRTGTEKANAIKEGPQAVDPADLYGFRLDHDPSRLIRSPEQVGFALMRPVNRNSTTKNMFYSEGEVPQGVRVDENGRGGTNTGALFNLLRKAFTPGAMSVTGAMGMYHLQQADETRRDI